MTVEAKIIFVTCDDEAHCLEEHKVLIELAMSKANLPFEIHQFPDGTGALEFLTAKENSKGVILITDGNMHPISGFILINKLHDSGLLPVNCIVCSSINLETFQELMRIVEIPVTASEFTNKDDMRHTLPPFITQALPAASAEVGLIYQPTKEPAEVRPPARRRRDTPLDAQRKG